MTGCELDNTNVKDYTKERKLNANKIMINIHGRENVQIYVEMDCTQLCHMEERTGWTLSTSPLLCVDNKNGYFNVMCLSPPVMERLVVRKYFLHILISSEFLWTCILKFSGTFTELNYFSPLTEKFPDCGNGMRVQAHIDAQMQNLFLTEPQPTEDYPFQTTFLSTQVLKTQ
jgi:hypothetical protein